MLVNVQLPGSDEITQMEEGQLVKSEGVDHSEKDITEWVEYRWNGVVVHRSAHVKILKLPQ
jgi:hypothetical protein